MREFYSYRNIQITEETYCIMENGGITTMKYTSINIISKRKHYIGKEKPIYIFLKFRIGKLLYIFIKMT